MNDFFSNFFDEKSGRWIGILRIVAIILFFGILLSSIIVGIVYASDYGDFGSFLIFLLGGAVFAFVQLVLNMLVIQLLNNVQAIRVRLENMGGAQQNEASAKGQSTDSLDQLLSQHLITEAVYNELKEKQA